MAAEYVRIMKRKNLARRYITAIVVHKACAANYARVQDRKIKLARLIASIRLALLIKKSFRNYKIRFG